MPDMKSKYNHGFTIVELLIVIVVIGILAAITIVAYSGVQDRAHKAKIASDIRQLTMAVHAARESTGKNLRDVTLSSSTGSQCWYKANDTDLAALPDTDSCISNYKLALDRISAASSANLSNLRDPWGRPYLIDENEGEGGGCGRDTVAVYKRPFTTGFGVHTYTTANNIPLAGYSGCV